MELIYKLVYSLKLKYLLKDTLLQTSELCQLSRRVIQFATAQIHSTVKHAQIVNLFVLISVCKFIFYIDSERTKGSTKNSFSQGKI